MPQSGYLLITDITGYTAFLTNTELDHAQEVLTTLFNSILDNMTPPLEVAKLEGDAIFAFAPQGSFVQGQTLLEAIEKIYVAFASARLDSERNTTCTCDACIRIPNLDLKFALHYGEYLEQQIAGSRELSGPDVILVHRLLKNDILTKTGIEAYGFITEQAAQAMRLEHLADAMIPHEETYEYLGTVKGFVHDLGPVWQAALEDQRRVITAEEAWFTLDRVLPVSAAMAWDYLNDPEYKRQWTASDKLSVSGTKHGRVGVGSAHHCAHGDQELVHRIVDWQPFDYVTFDLQGPFGSTVPLSIVLDAEDDTTQVTWRFGRPSGSNLVHDAFISTVSPIMRQFIERGIVEGSDYLVELTSREVQAGQVVLPIPMPRPDQDEIAVSVRRAMAS